MKPTPKCPFWDEIEAAIKAEHGQDVQFDISDVEDCDHGCEHVGFDRENGEWYCKQEAANGTDKYEAPETW